MLGAAGEPRAEQRLAAAARALVPGGDRIGVGAPQRLARLRQALGELVERGQQRVAVCEVDVRPDRAVGARHARAVAQARPHRGQAALLARADGALGLRDEQVGQHVRQVRDAREQPVMGFGVDRRGAGAEPSQQPVEPLVQHAGGAALRRGQIPGGALEEVRARVLHAGGLGSRQRMAADEALV